MQEGLITRYIIHEILKTLKNSSTGFEEIFAKKTLHIRLDEKDKKMIQNVVLTSMRFNFYINEIINNFSKKLDKNCDSYFLLLSAITQLIILKFKDFAVINSTVELTKNKKIYASTKFINGILRNINRKKNNLYLIDYNFSKLPKWFTSKLCLWNDKQKLQFAKTICEKPDLHIVFKNKNEINEIFNKEIKTTECSVSIKEFKKINTIKDFNKGLWWVQDFSSMMPLYLNNKIKNIKTADICAAPGGKTFQLLSYGADVKSYDKNEKKVKLMKQNLNRLNLDCEIQVIDFLKINNKIKYDLIILDAPCSSIGTIRRHPEIFFRTKKPNLNKILIKQEQLLEKSKLLLNKKGIIIYMVCSFFHEEGKSQIYKFLEKNKNFDLIKYTNKKMINKNLLIENDMFYYVVPQKLRNNSLIDGFFAAKMRKNA